MSRWRRDDDRDSKDRKASSGRESLNYMQVAKQSRSLDDYKRELGERGVTPERSQEWKKAMTARQALEASRQKASLSLSGRGNPSHNPARDYLAAAKQFRYREQYEQFLVKEWGVERDSKEWEKAQKDWELKEHLQDQQTHPQRGSRSPDDRELDIEAKREVLKAAFEANTREDFDAVIREKFPEVEPGSEKYEEYMTAWAVFKREKEGF